MYNRSYVGYLNHFCLRKIFEIKILLGESGKYATKGTIPGHAPLLLFGPKNNDRSSWISCVSRDGKGMGVYDNTATNSYKQICKKEVKQNFLNFKLN